MLMSSWLYLGLGNRYMSNTTEKEFLAEFAVSITGSINAMNLGLKLKFGLRQFISNNKGAVFIRRNNE
jgi:hypothetical protein